MSCAASAAEKATDCRDRTDSLSVWICFDAAVYSQENRILMYFCRQVLPEGVLFSGFAWCCNAPFPSRPSCFLLLIAHSFFLPESGWYLPLLCAAPLTSSPDGIWQTGKRWRVILFLPSLRKPMSFGLINNSLPQSFCSLSSGPYMP